MALTAFPEPADLQLSSNDVILDGRPLSFHKWDVSNPHPSFGKDPNILNEYGHTKFPMWTFSKIENKRIIVNNEMELAQHSEEAKPAEAGWGKPPELKEDGPTIHEYVAAGYLAKNYPPKGYASKSSEEEIKIAVDEEVAAEAKSQGWK